MEERVTIDSIIRAGACPDGVMKFVLENNLQHGPPTQPAKLMARLAEPYHARHIEHAAEINYTSTTGDLFSTNGREEIGNGNGNGGSHKDINGCGCMIGGVDYTSPPMESEYGCPKGGNGCSYYDLDML